MMGWLKRFQNNNCSSESGHTPPKMSWSSFHSNIRFHRESGHTTRQWADRSYDGLPGSPYDSNRGVNFDDWLVEVVPKP